MLLYPVYALLFADTGLSTAQISSLFLIWSITGFLLEVPSGVVADATSRRAVLAVGPLLTGAGFALWTAMPSYGSFALGFVLWGAQGALRSGALEALVYEELDRLGAASRYASVAGRGAACGTLAATLAIALAAPALTAGGYAAVGAASVAACVLCAAVGAGFPEHRVPAGGVEAPEAPYRAVLREGIGTVRADPAVRAALLLVPAVVVVWGSLDEYLPLLADEMGATREAVPLLMALVALGAVAGGLLGGAMGRRSPRALAVVLVAAAGALAAGALTGHPAGLAVVAVAFCGFQAATIAVEAGLQDAIDGAGRATVTSVAGLVTEIGTLAVFALYAAGSVVAGHAVLFAAFAPVYLLVAAVLVRRGIRPPAG